MIPFAKPRFHGKDVISKILASGQVTNGRYCRELEERMKEISGADYAIATNSCTTGLWLAQRALGFFKKKHGMWEKKIAVPAFTWTSTHWNIRRPVFIDCDIKTLNAALEPLCFKKLDGVVVTSVFGRSYSAGLVGREKKCPVICDSAHSIGLEMHEGADAEVYSLAPSKTFSGTEGGVMVTNDKKLAGELREEVKWAGRLEEVNAVMALYSLQRVKVLLRKKKELAHYYVDKLPFKFQDCGHKIEFGGLAMKGHCTSTHNEVCVIFPNRAMRDYVQRNLKDVETRIRYKPDERCSAKQAPNAWSIYNRSLNIPSWIGVDKVAVVEAIKKAAHLEAFVEFPGVMSHG